MLSFFVIPWVVKNHVAGLAHISKDPLKMYSARKN